MSGWAAGAVCAEAANAESKTRRSKLVATARRRTIFIMVRDSPFWNAVPMYRNSLESQSFTARHVERFPRQIGTSDDRVWALSPPLPLPPKFLVFMGIAG